MAVNILVNDGGAPARIMKVANAGADLDAGTIVAFDGTNVIAAAEDLPSLLNDAVGVLFVDATSGDPASVLTGSGIICFLKAAAGAIASGDKLGHDAAGLAVEATSGDQRFAVALEAKAATHSGYVKALVL
tara:strand:+ start:25 stop:417 length:393 start_codon:yes stop_codon:yes gene_type:complete